MSRNVVGDLEKLGPVNSRDRVSHITLDDYNRQASLRVTYERVTQPQPGLWYLHIGLKRVTCTHSSPKRLD